MMIVPVLLPLPLDVAFDYRVPDGMTEPAPGTFVCVPFGRREAIGLVWDRRSPTPVDPERVKPLLASLDAPPLPARLMTFIKVVARETVNPRGSVLKLAMSVPGALEAPMPKPAYKRGDCPTPGPKLSAARERVLACLDEHGPLLAAAELARRAKVSQTVLRAMADTGLIEARELVVDDEPMAQPDPSRAPVAFSAEQAAAVARLEACVAAGQGQILLEGVPGSGKTEVYLEAAATALQRGRNVLVLLPEIALSAQWLGRFEARFGVPPLVWHSGLTQATRRRAWRQVQRGGARVVVGARSSLFLPLDRLGLIVVDEEHDSSFKQEDGVVYHARDMALRRAKIEGCPIILCSATPSLETALAAGAVPGGPAAEPGWEHVRLIARHNDATMPHIETVDLRRERPPRGAFLSPPLRAALEETLEDAAQSLLFLNRRGYAPLTLCRACGHRLRCPNCTAWLTTHRFKNRLLCHHCGWGLAQPEHCPECGALDCLTVSGPGVERIAEEVQALLPAARIMVMTSDTVGTASRAAELVTAMTEKRVDVLIGTQMVAKGHHFPDLVTVGVVDADVGLAGGDPRAGERTFQLLYQVAGRAGRADRPGRVLVQTHLPDHPVMAALLALDPAEFNAAEFAERLECRMPPCGRLAALILAGRDAAQTRDVARHLVRSAPPQEGVTLLGPAPAPLALLRGRWRERILVKSDLETDLARWLRRWLSGQRLPASVSLQIDIDPVSFL